MFALCYSSLIKFASSDLLASINIKGFFNVVVVVFILIYDIYTFQVSNFCIFMRLFLYIVKYNLLYSFTYLLSYLVARKVDAYTNYTVFYMIAT